MKSASLFSGIGGFDLGLERAGIETVAQVEIDKDCVAVLASRFPSAQRYGDVRDVGAEEIGSVDLVAGGFPCQDLSVAGRRAGLAGDRSSLWFEFRRIVEEVRPAWVLIENVPGLYSSWSPVEPSPSAPAVDARPEDRTWDVEEDSDLAVVIEGLVELGYGVAWRCLDAQYFGVPQRRRRVFVVGCLGNPVRAAQVLLEPESCDGNPAPRRASWKETAGTLGGGTPGGGPRPDTDRMTFVPEVSKARGASPTATGHLDPTVETFVVGSLTSDDGDAATHQEVDAGHLVAAPLTAGSHPNSNEAGRHREDDENLIPALTTESGYKGEAITHALTSEGGDASEDGTGRGTPLVADTVRSHPRPGSNSLGNLAPTLTNPGKGSRGDKRVISYATKLHNTTSNQAGKFYEEYSPSLQQSSPPPAVGVSENQRAEVRLTDVSRQLSSGGGKPGQGYPAALQEMAVRRLTTIECCRLQGFPDWWLDGCHADADETNAREVLSTVRDAAGTEAFQKWGLGVLISLRASEVLWCEVHGTEFRSTTPASERLDDSALSRAEGGAIRTMRAMRESRCPGCASQKWKLAEQLAREFGAVVSIMSYARASGRKALCALRWASQGAGVLQPTLHPFPRGNGDCPNAISDSARYRMLGNAVCVPVAEWIAQRIVAVEKS